MVIDVRQTRPDPQLVDIKGSTVARVDMYNYSGIELNNKLSLEDYADFIVKKLNSRMHCLRKLNSFHITPTILHVFYTSTIVSVWMYSLVYWGGNVGKREKRRIESIVRKAVSVNGTSQPRWTRSTSISREESWRWCGVTIDTLSMDRYGIG